jgi:hypothetical protein
MKNNTLEYRVTQIEKRLDGIDVKIDKIRTEDIPDIKIIVETLSTRILILTGVNLTALLIAILVARFIK